MEVGRALKAAGKARAEGLKQEGIGRDESGELVTGSKGKWRCDWRMRPEQWVTGRSGADTGTPRLR